MSTAREIAITLKNDGFDLSTRNATIMALQEDLHYSEEEAVNIVDEIIKEANSL